MTIETEGPWHMVGDIDGPARGSAMTELKPCTCHPDERPDPCMRLYAFTDCQAAARAAPRTEGDDGEQPAPYRCKHGCERDELMDRITALSAEVERLNRNLTSRDSFIVNAGMFDDYLMSIGALGAKP